MSVSINHQSGLNGVIISNSVSSSPYFKMTCKSWIFKQFWATKKKKKKGKKKDTLRRIFERSRIINACYRPNQRSRSAPSCLRQTFPCVLWESSPCGPREPASSEAGSCWYDGRDLTAVDLNSIKDTALMKYSIFFIL